LTLNIGNGNLKKSNIKNFIRVSHKSMVRLIKPHHVYIYFRKLLIV